MQFRMFVPAMAGLAMTASAAFAQGAPAPQPAGQPGPMMGMRHMDPAEMQKHMAQMCQDHYAHAVGKVAELEARLNLTAAQKPLFERWKSSILSAAKDRVNDCQNLKMPERPISVVEGAKMHQKMLEAQLTILKAQMPALEALNASLSEEQQKVFRREAMEVMMEHRMGMMHHMDMLHGMHGDGMGPMHRDGAGERGAPPPPEE